MPTTDSKTTNVKVFSGPNFQTKIGDIAIPINYQLYSKAKYFGDKIFINVGNNDNQGGTIYEYSKKSLEE